MFGLGTPELIVILVIAFFVFGGKKLPELGAGLGKGIKAFQASLRDVEGVVTPKLKDNASSQEGIDDLNTKTNETANLNSNKT